MAKKQTPGTEEVSEFDLKHRITGAAVLLLLGALVLPWLLGPPSEASKVDSMSDSAKPSLLSNADIEPIQTNGNALGASEIAETVYISKITPLDAERDKELTAAANKAADKPGSNIGDKETDVEKSTPDVNENVTAPDQASKNEADEKDAVKAAQAAQERRRTELAKVKREKDKRDKAAREKALQDAVAAESDKQDNRSSAVDVGWVVQVGLFTEKSRALALISELKNKGFTASNSVVDTNRGPRTGTRVWLGPFAKRSAAQSEQKRLKSKAGKDGFIRVYP